MAHRERFGEFGKPVIIVADGAYAKRPFLSRVQDAGGIIVSRLRKDAALFDLPIASEKRGKGRPRKYGKNRLSPKKMRRQNGAVTNKVGRAKK